RIIRGGTARTPRHAERGKPGLTELRFLGEEFGVGGVGAGIAALDIIDAEFVEHSGYKLFVAQREIDPVGLGTVPQRRVKEIKAFTAHAGVPLALPSARAFSIVVLASHSPLTVTVFRCLAT